MSDEEIDFWDKAERGDFDASQSVEVHGGVMPSAREGGRYWRLDLAPFLGRVAR
jgi:hypothetical protein